MCCYDWQAGARLFGFIGAGATLGQLIGSLLAVGLARLGPGWISDFRFELCFCCHLWPWRLPFFNAGLSVIGSLYIGSLGEMCFLLMTILNWNEQKLYALDCRVCSLPTIVEIEFRVEARIRVMSELEASHVLVMPSVFAMLTGMHLLLILSTLVVWTVLLLIAALMMELAARCALGIGEDGLHHMPALISRSGSSL